MQFLWEQLILVSREAIMLRVVPQLTFFPLIDIYYGFFHVGTELQSRSSYFLHMTV